MKGIAAVALLLVSALGPMAAGAADSPPAIPAAGEAGQGTSAAPSPEASIAFANHGGIYNWQVVNDHTVLIQGLNHHWYQATLLAPCVDLPFAQRLGFESNPDGSFDKFSAITVRHQRCPLVSLVKTSPPSKKSKPNKGNAVAAGSTPGNAATSAEQPPK
jgi:hypothetical protein